MSLLSGFGSKIVLTVACFLSPSSVLTSPQINLHPILRSITGWIVKESASKCAGFTKQRKMPGVYSKNSFASTMVTWKCFLRSRAEKSPENAPPTMRTRRLWIGGIVPGGGGVILLLQVERHWDGKSALLRTERKWR